MKVKMCQCVNSCTGNYIHTFLEIFFFFYSCNHNFRDKSIANFCKKKKKKEWISIACHAFFFSFATTLQMEDIKYLSKKLSRKENHVRLIKLRSVTISQKKTDLID